MDQFYRDQMSQMMQAIHELQQNYSTLKNRVEVQSIQPQLQNQIHHTSSSESQESKRILTDSSSQVNMLSSKHQHNDSSLTLVSNKNIPQTLVDESCYSMVNGTKSIIQMECENGTLLSQKRQDFQLRIEMIDHNRDKRLSMESEVLNSSLTNYSRGSKRASRRRENNTFDSIEDKENQEFTPANEIKLFNKDTSQDYEKVNKGVIYQ